MFTIRFDSKEERIAVGTARGMLHIYNLKNEMYISENDINAHVNNTPITAVR